MTEKDKIKMRDRLTEFMKTEMLKAGYKAYDLSMMDFDELSSEYCELIRRK